MQENRRNFLRKSLKIGAGATLISTIALANSETSGSGVVKGKSKKKEVLYKKSEAWEKYYKTVY